MKKKLATMKKLAKEADEKLALADAYLVDGAPASAARCYREAADLLDKWAKTRNDILSEV